MSDATGVIRGALRLRAVVIESSRSAPRRCGGVRTCGARTIGTAICDNLYTIGDAARVSTAFDGISAGGTEPNGLCQVMPRHQPERASHVLLRRLRVRASAPYSHDSRVPTCRCKPRLLTSAALRIVHRLRHATARLNRATVGTCSCSPFGPITLRACAACQKLSCAFCVKHTFCGLAQEHHAFRMPWLIGNPTSPVTRMDRHDPVANRLGRGPASRSHNHPPL